MAGAVTCSTAAREWRRLKETTAIQADPYQEGEVATASPARFFSLLGVLLLAVVMALVPVLFALGLAPQSAVAAAGFAGVLGTVFGGMKLAAFAWGLVSKGSETRFRAPVSVIE
jgi:hypothetical protein